MWPLNFKSKSWRRGSQNYYGRVVCVAEVPKSPDVATFSSRCCLGRFTYYKSGLSGAVWRRLQWLWYRLDQLRGLRLGRVSSNICCSSTASGDTVSRLAYRIVFRYNSILLYMHRSLSVNNLESLSVNDLANFTSLEELYISSFIFVWLYMHVFLCTGIYHLMIYKQLNQKHFPKHPSYKKCEYNICSIIIL